MSAGQVLLIENDEVDAASIQASLTELGASTTRVRGGTEGLQYLQRSRPDMIIIADDLPTISGYVICKQIKQNKQLRDIPVALVSKNPAAEKMFAHHARYSTRAEDYLFKPLETDHLRDLLQSHGMETLQAFVVEDELLVESLDIGFDDFDLDGALSEGMEQVDIEMMDNIEVGDDVEMMDNIEVGDDVEMMDSIEVGDDVEMMDSIEVGDDVEMMDSIEVGDSVDVIAPGEMEMFDGLEEMSLEEVPDEEFSVLPDFGEIEISSEEPELVEAPVKKSPFSSLPEDEHILDVITAGLEFGEEESSTMILSPDAEQKQKIRSLEQEIGKLKRGEQERESLRARLREAERERNALRDVEATHLQTIRRLQEECDTLHDIEATQQEAIERLQDEREDLQKRLDRIARKMRGQQDSGARVAELEHEVHGLTVQLDFARDEHEQKADELKAIHRSELEGLLARLQRFEQGFDSLRSTLTQQLQVIEKIQA